SEQPPVLIDSSELSWTLLSLHTRRWTVCARYTSSRRGATWISRISSTAQPWRSATPSGVAGCASVGAWAVAAWLMRCGLSSILLAEGEKVPAMRKPPPSARWEGLCCRSAGQGLSTLWRQVVYKAPEQRHPLSA